jgi:hypothetical protein
MNENENNNKKSHETVPLSEMGTNPCLGGAVFILKLIYTFADQLSCRGKM